MMWRAYVDLPPTAAAPMVARRLLDQLLLGWNQPHLNRLADDAHLVVSELVTNVVIHAAETDALHLDIDANGDGSLRIAVVDDSPVAPVVKDPTSDAEGGRGLQIVQQLGVRWGADIDPNGGKRVWVELR